MSNNLMIQVSRQQLEYWRTMLQHGLPETVASMIGTVLAAPVVERQAGILDISAERNAMQRQRDLAVSQLKRECDSTDAALKLLGLEPDNFRTDGGALNLAKLKNSISPPAPVAVVLPDRNTITLKYPLIFDGTELVQVWRACLDKVKELNQ